MPEPIGTDADRYKTERKKHVSICFNKGVRRRERKCNSIAEPQRQQPQVHCWTTTQ